MKKEEVKIYSSFKVQLIGGIIFSIAIMVSGLFFIIVPSGYIATIVFDIIGVILLLIILCNPSFWVIFSDESLEIRNLFGKLKKKEDWRNLSSVYIRTLWGGRMCFDYFVLNFSDKEEEFIQYTDAWQTDHILLFLYTKKNEEILKKYTDFPIIDKRSSKKKLKNSK